MSNDLRDAWGTGNSKAVYEPMIIMEQCVDANVSPLKPNVSRS